MSIATSVIICSRNRAELLRETLLALQAPLEEAQQPVEVIVVNNASTDATDSVIKAARLPVTLRRVLAPHPGLSHARNAGVLAARGTLLLWTDDDVSPSSQWLRAYEQAVQDWPNAAFFGGPVEPVLQGIPPAWLQQSLTLVRHSFAAVDYGPTTFAITRVAQTPFGANYAIRADVQRHHPYDPTLGRQPQHYWLAGEETNVLGAILATGGHGRWLPDARVQHRIPANRQSRRTLFAQAVGGGRTQIRRQQLRGADRVGLRALLRSGASVLRHMLRTVPYPLLGEHRRYIPRLYDMGTAIGQWRELRRYYQTRNELENPHGI